MDAAKVMPFLQALGVPLDNLTQAGMDQRVLDATVIWKAKKTGRYISPNNLPLPTNIPGLIPFPGDTMEQAIAKLADPAYTRSATTAAVIDAMEEANYTMIACRREGDLEKFHAACDAINALQPLTKQPFFVPQPTDLDVVRTSPTSAGLLLQELEGLDTLPILLTDLDTTSKIMADYGVE